MLIREPGSVYLDNAASTPLDPAVTAAMCEALGSAALTANASSATHAPGRQAAAALERARASVAALVGADAREVVFTSGATEADNLAVLGTAKYRERDGRHILSARTEHKAVTVPLEQLAALGFDVEWLEVDPASGSVAPDTVRAALRDDTVLVALMAVNNEIGAIQDVASIAALCREHGASCHVDAAQAPGKMPFDLREIPADTVALSAHKMYGPKGVGALVCRARFAPQITPLMFGGGQERGLRPGTPATHQAIGFGVAAERCLAEGPDEFGRIERLNARLTAGLTAVPGVTENGKGGPRVPHIVSVSVADVHGDSLTYAMEPVAVSTGSACTTLTREPSPVLRALGLADALAEATLRFSLGRFSTGADVDAAVRQFTAAVTHLRAVGGVTHARVS